MKKRIDTHYYSEADQRELVNREVFEKKRDGDAGYTLNEFHRESLFKRGWKQRLEKLRKEHRELGLNDGMFMDGIK